MKILLSFVFVALTSTFAFAQIPTATLVTIVKAEDERRFDKDLETLIDSKSNDIKIRAILAAGRIGDERAVSQLLLALKSSDGKVKQMAAFALGEIESITAAGGILEALSVNESVDYRAIEAAGKIVAANPKHEKSKLLGEAILDLLEFEDKRRSKPNAENIMFGLTAVIRAKPEESDFVVAKFLTYSDAGIRANAMNTLARLRVNKPEINSTLRAMLLSDDDAVCRANACRILGSSVDVLSVSMLLEAAQNDDDSRVRVSAIRALGNFKDVKEAKDLKVADALIARGEVLLKRFKINKTELLEIATSLGRLLTNVVNESAISFLKKLDSIDNFSSSETKLAFGKMSREKFVEYFRGLNSENSNDWMNLTTYLQAQSELGEFATETDTKKKFREDLQAFFNIAEIYKNKNSKIIKTVPDALLAYSKLKDVTLEEILRKFLSWEDIQIRATAASLLSEFPASKLNFEALNLAFDTSFLKDSDSNDAMLAILDALFKVNQKDSLPIIFLALNSDDYLVRKKAFELMKKDGSEYAKSMVERAISQGKDKVLPYKQGSKQGVILNKNADYIRAVSRKNGSVKAIFTTEKGNFTIDLVPEDAPLTVDNFVKLANAKYFNGLSVHRVVANFVMQDGDPRGDGNGGPGYSIRCEVNMLEYNRGAVGMALSGKDTGGSQWFATHSPQPHLDGGYTVFGKVNETDMKIVDSIARGDKILKVVIMEGKASANVRKRKK
jgi:cyclophilin family peptidyl-prolyl cis-trans isomerase/HEAT repeat protein